MSDSREYVYGRNLFYEELEHMLAGQSTEPSRRVLAVVRDCLPAEAPLGVYCACFSTRADQLSQWRGYGDHGRGIALAMDRQKLVEAVPHAVGLWVVYKVKSQVEYVRSYLSLVREGLLELSPDADAEFLESVRLWLSTHLALASMALKHDGFSEESEFRLVTILTDTYTIGGFASAVRFRTQAGTLIPYLALPAQQYLPVTGVKLGPGMQDSYHVDAVRMLLRSCHCLNVDHPKNPGYTKIDCSRIPFRC